ncbi:hypothetical protein FQR65_LT05062 [Abscondita terminalis]|nr:hypothetical protein FQR65_LT05062 [Abscondita terminalis]
MVLSLVIGCGCHIYILQKDFKTIFDVTWLLTFVNFTSCARSCILLYLSLILGKRTARYIKSLESQIRQHLLTTSDDILPMKSTKIIRTKLTYYVTGSICIVCLDLILFDNNGVFLKFIDLIAVIFNLILLMFYAIVADLYNNLLGCIYNNFKNLECLRLEGKLFPMLRSYMRLHQNFKYHNETYGSGVFFWILITIFSTVAITFALIMMLFTHVQSPSLTVTTFRAYVNYAIMLTLTMKIETLQANHQQMLSFFYKYPSRYLRSDGGSQIELILNMFRMCKPSLDVLGIFEIGIKLCAMVRKRTARYIKSLESQIRQHVLTTSDDILPMKTTKKIRAKLIYYVTGSICIVCLDIILVDNNGVFLKFIDLIAVIFNLILLLFYAIVTDLYNNLLECIYNNFKNLECLRLEGKLFPILRSYMRIHQNFKYHNETYGSGVFFWILITILSTVAITFVYIMMLFHHVQSSLLTLATFRAYVNYAIMYILMMKIETLQANHQQMLSFFYKYPSRYLGSDGGTQIEFILNMFRLCKPSLDVLGIFEIGIKLCAMISATVATYILVLIQFYLPSDQFSNKNGL